jgi:hypothetical protein
MICPNETLAETLQPAGLHSEVSGVALPAPVPFLQDKEISSNHPKGGSHGTK